MSVETAVAGHAVGDCLVHIADPRDARQVTFGISAVIVDGIDKVLLAA
jgi:hypothetical protein